MTSRITSRARGRHARARAKGVTNQQSFNLNLVAIPVAMGLSPKPRCGFSWFFVCKFVWMSRVLIAKIITIGSIPLDLEVFSITMATAVNLSKFWICHDLLIPNPDLCVRFRQDSFRNGPEVRFQRYKGLAYYCMISLHNILLKSTWRVLQHYHMQPLSEIQKIQRF